MTMQPVEPAVVEAALSAIITFCQRHGKPLTDPQIIEGFRTALRERRVYDWAPRTKGVYRISVAEAWAGSRRILVSGPHGINEVLTREINQLH